jgi:RNA polymerase sigma factor (sigma-70 family)
MEDCSTADAGEETALGLVRGDSRAVRTVRRRVRRILSFKAIRLATHIREDLEQEVMTDVWRAVNRAGFDASRGFWGFVETVTARRCIDWLRARRLENAVPIDLADPTPCSLSRVLEGERSRLAFEVLSKLDPSCRQLIYLQVGLGKSYRQIGAMLGKSEGALRIQMYRCVRAARALLHGLSESPTYSRMPRKDRA